MSAPNAFADLIPTPATPPPAENSFADLIPKEQTNSFADLIPKQPDQSNSAFDPAMWSKVQGMKRGTKEHPSENYLTLTHIGSQLGFLGVHGFETKGHDPNGAHPTGDAVDFRTRDKSWEEGNQFIAKMRKMGLTVIDERRKPGQPHIHVQVPKGGMFKGDFTPFPPPPEKPFVYDPTGIYDVAGQATKPNTPAQEFQLAKAQGAPGELIGHGEGSYGGGGGQSLVKQRQLTPAQTAAEIATTKQFEQNKAEWSQSVHSLPGIAQIEQLNQIITERAQRMIPGGSTPVGKPIVSAVATAINPLNWLSGIVTTVLDPVGTGETMVLHPAETLDKWARGEPVSQEEKAGAITQLASLPITVALLHFGPPALKAVFAKAKTGDVPGAVATLDEVHQAWNARQIEDLTNQRIEIQARTVTKSGKPKANVNPKDQALLNTLDSQIQALKPPPVSETAPNVQAPETAPSAPANNVSRETPVLQSAIIPGAKEFIEQDVVPSIESGIEGARQIASDIKQGLNPAGIDDPSKLMAGTIRDRDAELHLNTARIERSVDSARKTMGKMPEAEQYDFIHKMEAGAKQKNPEMDVVAKALRTGLDDRAKQVQALGTGALKGLIQDYFPHTWERPKQNIVAAVFGKRPMQGPANFIKKRTIPTTADGLAAGLKPVTTNPVDLTLLKIREMDRYLMAHRVFKEAKANKEIKVTFVKWNGDVPDGYVKLNDRIARVYEGVTGQGSLAQRGDYYAPAGAAKVFNNYLSPGLKGVRAYDWVRSSGNMLNQAQLGMSAFHLGFTAMDAVTSKAALSLELASRKQFGKAALEAVKVPTAAFETYFKGDKLLKAIYKNDPRMAQYVDALQKAGGRIKMDNFYSTGAIEGLKNALKKHNYIGAGIRAPFAVIEAVAKPVMEHAVPRMKLGVFMDLAKIELERLGPTATDAAKREVLGKVWDSVDNRMGQMTYDNLFWDKTAKDLAMVSVRSVGWNLGTIRELGGAVLDTATVLKRVKQGDPWLTHRMAYAAVLPVTTALVGSIVNYLYTGKGPDSLKDMFYPRTGQKNLDGTEERMQLPTYMKEVYPVASALAHGNVSRAVQHAGDAATAKVHPLISASIQMMRNKDYYGDEIRHGGDPIVKQLLAEAGFAGSQFLPFSVRNIQKTQEQTGKTNLAPLIGITPAPRNLSKSDALLKAQEIMSNKMSDAPKTSADRAKMDAKNALVRDAVSGGISDSELGKRALQAGLTKAQARNLIKKVNERRLVYLAQQMSIDEAWSVYEEGTQAEKKELLPVIQRKVHNLVGDSDTQGSDPKRGRDFYNAHRELFKH